MKNISIALNWSFYGITFLSWIHALIVVAWATSTLSNGFSEGILHATPIAFEIIVIKLLSMCTGLQSWSKLQESKWNVIFTIVFLIGAIGINVTHFVFTAIELNECTSEICMFDYYFLLMFIILLGSLAITEVCLIWYLIKLVRYLNLAIKEKKETGTVERKIWINLFSWIQCIILICWALGAYVNGFVNGIFHFTPIAYEILLFKTISETTLFAFDIFRNKVTPSIQTKRTIITVLLVMLIIGVGFNITQFIFSVDEIISCTSVYCLGNYAFAVFFVVLIGIESFLELLFIVFIWMFGKEIAKQKSPRGTRE